MQRKVVELHNAVVAQECHSSVLKLDFGAALAGSQGRTFANGHVERRSLPYGPGVRKGIIVERTGEANIPLNQAQANDPNMAVIRGSCTRQASAKEQNCDTQKGNRSSFHGIPRGEQAPCKLRR